MFIEAYIYIPSNALPMALYMCKKKPQINEKTCIGENDQNLKLYPYENTIMRLTFGIAVHVFCFLRISAMVYKLFSSKPSRYNAIQRWFNPKHTNKLEFYR